MEKLRTAIRDCVGVAGVIAVSYGALEIYRPAGFVVAGTFLLAWALYDGLGPER